MSGKFKTTPLQLGEETFNFARLSFGDMEELGIMELLEAGGLPSLPPSKQIPLVIEMAHRSLKRAAPEIPRKKIADALDQDNAGDVFNAIMGTTGFVPARAEALGNAEGGTPGVGQPSTPTSPPASAGPSSTAAST